MAATSTRPVRIARTRPVDGSTRTMVESLDVQTTAAPGTRFPAASRASAARLAVLSGRSDRAGRCVMTTATGGELSIPTEPPT